MDVEQVIREEYEEPITKVGHDRQEPTRVFFMAETNLAWYKPDDVEPHGLLFVDHYNPSGHIRYRSEALAIAEYYGVALIERCVNCGGDAVLVDGVAQHLPPVEEPCTDAQVFLGKQQLQAA